MKSSLEIKNGCNTAPITKKGFLSQFCPQLHCFQQCHEFRVTSRRHFHRIHLAAETALAFFSPAKHHWVDGIAALLVKSTSTSFFSTAHPEHWRGRAEPVQPWLSVTRLLYFFFSLQIPSHAPCDTTSNTVQACSAWTSKPDSDVFRESYVSKV